MTLSTGSMLFVSSSSFLGVRRRCDVSSTGVRLRPSNVSLRLRPTASLQQHSSVDGAPAGRRSPGFVNALGLSSCLLAAMMLLPRPRVPGRPVQSQLSHRALAMVQPALAERGVQGLALPQSMKFSLRDRFNFAVAEFLMWHPAARVFALFLLAILVIYGGARLFKALDPSGEETNKSPEWVSVRAYLNPSA